MKLALMLSLGALWSTLATAASPLTTVDSHVRAYGDHSPVPAVRPEAMQPGRFEQAINHFGASLTFSQRYWVDSEYASGPDAPVIYHMCGEADVDQAYFLDDFALEWAKVLKARVVLLEHRYYGQSQPYSDLSGPHLQYLTLDNVMEDLASFQKWLTASQGWTGKWIAVGGSYSATMAALYRQKHPELVVGALASSAPMISGIGDVDDSEGDISSSTSTDDDGRAWAYQACTETGYWLAEGGERGAPLEMPGPRLCQSAFGNVKHYDAAAYNKLYNAPFISRSAGAPSNILFTYGSDDVWTDIGLATQTNDNPNITIRMIDGAGHHYDLNGKDGSDSRAVNDAREAFTALAKQWLAR